MVEQTRRSLTPGRRISSRIRTPTTIYTPEDKRKRRSKNKSRDSIQNGCNRGLPLLELNQDLSFETNQDNGEPNRCRSIRKNLSAKLCYSESSKNKPKRTEKRSVRWKDFDYESDLWGDNSKKNIQSKGKSLPKKKVLTGESVKPLQSHEDSFVANGPETRSSAQHDTTEQTGASRQSPEIPQEENEYNENTPLLQTSPTKASRSTQDRHEMEYTGKEYSMARKTIGKSLSMECTTEEDNTPLVHLIPRIESVDSMSPKRVISDFQTSTPDSESSSQPEESQFVSRVSTKGVLTESGEIGLIVFRDSALRSQTGSINSPTSRENSIESEEGPGLTNKREIVSVISGALNTIHQCMDKLQMTEATPNHQNPVFSDTEETQNGDGDSKDNSTVEECFHHFNKNSVLQTSPHVWSPNKVQTIGESFDDEFGDDFFGELLDEAFMEEVRRGNIIELEPEFEYRNHLIY